MALINGKRPVSSYVCSRNRQLVVGNRCIGYKTAFGEVRQIAPRKSCLWAVMD
ncbi:MAG: hypothetical protein QOE55_3560 [Acidobacteriaceae bacterium]|nr:hypothetical protein [Acidobacteriaceae bacterium]